MKTYTISVKELLSRDIEMQAESYDEARSKVKELYDKEEIVLTADDFAGATFVDICL